MLLDYCAFFFQVWKHGHQLIASPTPLLRCLCFVIPVLSSDVVIVRGLWPLLIRETGDSGYLSTSPLD